MGAFLEKRDGEALPEPVRHKPAASRTGCQTDITMKLLYGGDIIMKKIVVIGGGTMGLDIAQVFATQGL